MHFRHLEYFVVLAQERHFARAAARCNVTQSTLSAALRQLEEEVGAPLVARDHRFRELTKEGAVVLDWARAMLDERAALQGRLGTLSGRLEGRLRLGAIPTALPTVALVTTPFKRSHPAVHVTVSSLSSEEIQRGLDEFTLDCGITYLDNEPLHGVRSFPLYREHYSLVVPMAPEGPRGATVTWLEAAARPLCLLTPDMQNRRILDQIFASVGAVPSIAIEAASLLALYAHVRCGPWGSVLPNTLLWLLGDRAGLDAKPLVAPDLSHAVGLVVRETAPQPPVIAALEQMLPDLALDDRLRRPL